MKTVLSKINLTALALFFLLLPGLNSCKKDNDDNNNNDQPVEEKSLVGTWDVTSFKIGGVETKGQIISDSEMKFEADGDFTWVITYNDNSSDTATGQYEINKAGDRLTFTSDEQEALAFDLELDGDEIKLSGVMDVGSTVIKAERK